MRSTNKQRDDHHNLPTIISDSFLRSYSLSRIVRINEENRNKAKVAIMRKIREFKQHNHEQKQQYHNEKKEEKSKILTDKTNKDNHPIKNTQLPTNIRALKQQLSMINDDGETIDTPSQKGRKSRKQCRSRNAKKQQSIKNKPMLQNNLINNSLNNKMLKLNPQKANQTKCFQQTIQDMNDQVNHPHLKTLLRMNNLKFDQLLCKNNIALHNTSQTNNQQFDELQSPLSTALNSFNRLKLMMNTKSSENIMKHFYKRSLENCTIDDIKFLMKMQSQKTTKNHQNAERQISTPMKFGKPSYLRKTFGSPEDLSMQIKGEINVWKNELLQKKCSINQNNDNRKKISQRFTTSQQSKHRNVKRNTFDARLKKSLKGQQKQNFETKQIFRKMSDKSTEMQKNVFFTYKDKRFPMSENKLNGIYKKWQMSYLQKKNNLQIEEGQRNFGEQLRTKNIRLQSYGEDDDLVDTNQQCRPSQISLARNTTSDQQSYMQCRQIGY